jgi:pyruvate ferredoxin oxidoreductase gamma subunit
MHETVWLGRGGQGAFTAARLLGIAAMLSGKQAMAMPSFGPERRGAPVFAYTRIDAAKVRDRSAVRQADAAVILDETLLTQVPTGFLTPKTLLIIDSESEKAEPTTPVADRVVRIPARRIAREIMGSEHTNSALFGALVGLTGVVSQSAAEEGIRRELGTGSKGVKNLAAFRHAFSYGVERAERGVANV